MWGSDLPQLGAVWERRSGVRDGEIFLAGTKKMRNLPTRQEVTHVTGFVSHITKTVATAATASSISSRSLLEKPELVRRVTLR